MINQFLSTIRKSPSGYPTKKDVNKFLTFLCFTPFVLNINTDSCLICLPLEYKKILFKNLRSSHYYSFKKLSNTKFEFKLPKIVKHMVFKENKIIISKKLFLFIKEPLIDELFKVWNITSLRKVDKLKRFSDTSKKNLKFLGFQFIPVHPAYLQSFHIDNSHLQLMFNKFIINKQWIVEKMLKRKLKYKFKNIKWEIKNTTIHLYNIDGKIIQFLSYPYKNLSKGVS